MYNLIGGDCKMSGIFGDLFDFNKDGKLDPMEEAMDFAMFMTLMDEDNKDDYSIDELDDFDLLDDD